MRLLTILACAAVAAGVGLYFFEFRSSTTSQATTALAEASGPNTDVSLKGCRLILVTENSLENGLIEKTRTVVRVDLPSYNIATPYLSKTDNGYVFVVPRKPANRRMFDQARKIIDLADERAKRHFSENISIRDLLDQKGDMIFFALLSPIVSGSEPKPHKDAPSFYRFAEAVDNMPAPTSYRISMSFLKGGISEDNFMTGEIVAIPNLKFPVTSSPQAEKLGRALFDYTVENGCG